MTWNTIPAGIATEPNIYNISASQTFSDSGPLFIYCNCTGGAISVGIPTSVRRRYPITIQKTDSSENAITITAPGDQTISGESSITISTQYGLSTLLPYEGNYTVAPTPGSLSATAPISVTDNVIAVSNATTEAVGVVEPDGTTVTVDAGVISVPTATTSALGLVKPDGTTIDISAGVISVPNATSGAAGLMTGTQYTELAGYAAGTLVANSKSSGSAPTVAAGAACSAASLTAGNDNAGTVSATGNVSPSTGALFTVTFNASFGSTPKGIAIEPLNAASAPTIAYVSALSATAFTVSASVAPGVSAAMSFSYVVIG